MISTRGVVLMALTALVGSGAGLSGGSAGRHETTEAKLDRAAAAFLEDRKDDARRQLDALPPGACERPQDRDRSSKHDAALRQALRCLLLRAALDTAGPDPFQVLTEILEQGDWDERDPLVDVTWVRLFAKEAADAGYRPIALHALRRSARRLGYDAEATSLPAGQRADAAASKQVIDRELKALETRAEPSGTGSPAGDAATDSVAPRIAALLAAPRLHPFPESALPEGVRPSAATEPMEQEEDEETDDEGASAAKTTTAPGPGTAPAPAQGFTFPSHFAVVRAERKGSEAAAIGLSQDYDPVGEISRGAYWVLRSHDGGTTWGKRLYTGLRIEAPYVVHSGSLLPLIAGDHLDVEVSIRELDEDSITFPPVALKAKREQDGLRLTIPFADLERDTDGDGLTDLAEERLVTDPADPDTDGDGLGDASDPLPQVAWSGLMNDESAALSAVLEEIAGMKSMAIIHEVGKPDRGVDDLLSTMRRATLSSDRTTFVTADRRPFRSLALSQRLVVLTEDEVDAARRKFGPLLPVNLDLFVLDHQRQHGYVIWDAGWVGGTLELERTEGLWQVKTLGSWIT